MPKNLSIGVQLGRARTYQKQKEVLLGWSQNWMDDQISVIRKLRRAAERNDHAEIMHMIDQLQGLTDKRFTGLNNVFRRVSDPDRILEDEREI